MDIQKYQAYFHDGDLIKFQHLEDVVEISLASAEVTLKDFNRDVSISKNNRLEGKLHLQNIQKVLVNDKLFKEELKKNYDSGEILDLIIGKDNIEITVSWNNYPPNDCSKSDCINYKIFASKIYWEPMQIKQS